MTDPATNTENPLFAYILTILTPLLLTNTMAQATQAARQAIAAYKAPAQDQLLSIAQIIGLALASLDDLRLSAAPELSLPMKLKLRGNANALTRSSQRATTTLQAQRHDTEAIPNEVPPDEAEILASLAAACIEGQQAGSASRSPSTAHVEQPTQPPLTPQAQSVQQSQSQAQPAAPAGPKPQLKPPVQPAIHAQAPALQLQTSINPCNQYPRDQSWAHAMTEIAVELAAELTHLPTAQRQIQLTKIRALTKTASVLSQGSVPLKARLLSTASLLSTMPPQQPNVARNVVS